MTLSKTIARAILNLATHNPPESVARWAMAMRREFDELHGGELSWALECAGAMAFARLKVERYYWALLVIAPVLLIWFGPSLSTAVFEWARGDAHSFSVTRRAFKISCTIAAFSPLPIAMLVGFYRPDRAFTTMLFGGLVMQHVGNTLYWSWRMDTDVFGWWNFSADVYGGAAMVGLAASLGIWYAGARLGGWLAETRARRFA